MTVDFPKSLLAESKLSVGLIRQNLPWNPGRKFLRFPWLNVPLKTALSLPGNSCHSSAWKIGHFLYSQNAFLNRCDLNENGWIMYYKFRPALSGGTGLGGWKWLSGQFFLQEQFRKMISVREVPKCELEKPWNSAVIERFSQANFSGSESFFEHSVSEAPKLVLSKIPLPPALLPYPH